MAASRGLPGHCDTFAGATLAAAFRAPDWNHTDKENFMLYTIAMVLLILWLLGLVTSTTMGGFIHVLLVIAVIVVLLRVISGRRVL